MATRVQTVLVVEDETSIASFVALYLKNAGYRVQTAGTGQDALETLNHDRPDLIVLDLMLPDIDGIEVCRRIRRGSDIPILMLTARARSTPAGARCKWTARRSSLRRRSSTSSGSCSTTAGSC